MQVELASLPISCEHYGYFHTHVQDEGMGIILMANYILRKRLKKVHNKIVFHKSYSKKAAFFLQMKNIF